ncbi:MAG: winged helix-turn-helix transcriptional regulator [Clostridiales bacterium]|nr:winged helix-turn-helix transcriptional regulator [Clostridiales bacterium]
MREFEEYKKLGELDKREKSEIWETAIGLQQVDGLKPSQYLIHTAKSHIEGDITFEDVKNQLSNYYQEKPAKTDKEKDELEADIVSARIAEILSEKAFSLSFVEFISIHKRLFDGLFDFAGTIRNYNIEKKEWILDGKSVTYGNYFNIKEYIEYDLQEEKKFSYKGLNQEEILNHIAEFTSKIWQIHAFGEGNTRTVAVFLIKYLRTLGFDIDNTLFSENSWYFRNSLVRANYDNYTNNIYATNVFLIKFLQNLLFNGNNTLKNRYLHISNDTVNDTVKNQNDTVFSLIKQNNKITANEISVKLGKSLATIKRKIKDLKERKVIERIGSDKAGSWKILKEDEE